MRKNGFTLIELLAVIVILAIIALIATPIILGIINDAREKANERSVELYAAAVKNAIAAYQLTGLNAPKSFSDLTIQYDGDVKCAVQELYADGNFYLEGCKVNNGEKEYSYGTKQEVPIEVGKFSSVCKPAEGTEYNTTEGTKYNCKVDPNKDPYTFYVLNATSTEVNLIMDSNINENGNAVKGDESVLGLVAWSNNKNYEGPVIAKAKLHEGTKNWTNLKPVNYFYNGIAGDYGYTSLSATNGILTISPKEGSGYEITEIGPMYSRLPFKEELSDYSEELNNSYLYENLWLKCTNFSLHIVSCDSENIISIDGLDIEGLNHKMGIEGYWTASSTNIIRDSAINVYYNGTLGGGTPVGNDDQYGVRPVINLSI